MGCPHFEILSGLTHQRHTEALGVCLSTDAITGPVFTRDAVSNRTTVAETLAPLASTAPPAGPERSARAARHAEPAGPGARRSAGRPRDPDDPSPGPRRPAQPPERVSSTTRLFPICGTRCGGGVTRSVTTGGPPPSPRA